MKCILIWALLCSHTILYADAQVLHLHHIGSEGVAGLPEFMGSWSVDDRTILQYDSNTMHMDADAPIPDWLSSNEGPSHWRGMNFVSRMIRRFLVTTLNTIGQHDNLTASPPQARLYQTHGYCQLNPDGTMHTSVSHGYNGKDFVTFDIPARTWAAAVPQAVHLVKCRANRAFDLENLYYYYNYECIERLKTILKYAPWIHDKKVPEVGVIESRGLRIPSKVEVTCHVTGFYPRAVQVEWLGAEGLPLVDGVSSGEVLPNGDGSYQLRKSLTLPQGAQYTQHYSCLVLHSSVAGNITVNWVPKTRSSYWRASILTVIGCLLFLTLLVCCRREEEQSERPPL
ncbi:major histocompatibility complex class I-related gene protein-like [Coregonus clupeaformis]|uniref:major histocompatibility complex class I-related gene protein-like n=1 Tax=Coregonus clupeaformis TaxID=59861 RepID=UPI001E1C6C63|nr:major histocompatibility complex class I-related gene protein-like [Coregonus clupeaformis]